MYMKYMHYVLTVKLVLKRLNAKNPISDDRCEKIGGNWADYLAHTTNYNYVLWGCNFIKEC